MAGHVSLRITLPLSLVLCLSLTISPSLFLCLPPLCLCADLSVPLFIFLLLMYHSTLFFPFFFLCFLLPSFIHCLSPRSPSLPPSPSLCRCLRAVSMAGPMLITGDTSLRGAGCLLSAVFLVHNYFTSVTSVSGSRRAGETGGLWRERWR